MTSITKHQRTTHQVRRRPASVVRSAGTEIRIWMALGLFGLLGTLTSTALAQNPVPLINQPLVPDAAKPGGAGFTLTVNGTGFVSGAVVNWNGSALATTFISDSQLTASVPAANIATASTASVTVVNPTPGGGSSNVAFLSVTQSTSSISLLRTDYGGGDRALGRQHR